MTKEYRDHSLAYWNETHQMLNYERKLIKIDDWLERFEELIMETHKPIPDLGCGGGNDTLYLLGKGKKVIPCDQSEYAIDNLKRNFPEIPEALCFNMLDGFPFDDESFDVVIADLCLHYFDSRDTDFVISEIKRILTPGGHLLARVNSLNDVNHGAGQGKEIEHHVYESKSGTLKRFFDEEDIRLFFRKFKIEYLKEESMGRYKLEKRVYRLCVQK